MNGLTGTTGKDTNEADYKRTNFPLSAHWYHANYNINIRRTLICITIDRNKWTLKCSSWNCNGKHWDRYIHYVNVSNNIYIYIFLGSVTAHTHKNMWPVAFYGLWDVPIDEMDDCDDPQSSRNLVNKIRSTCLRRRDHVPLT